MKTTEAYFESSHLIKVDCRDILLGMYIYELDRAWSETPFPVDGYHVKSGDDIQKLQKFCKTVYIDTNRGVAPSKSKKSQLTILSNARRAVPQSVQLKVNRDVYPTTKKHNQQLNAASRAYSKLKQEFASLTNETRISKKLSMGSLEKSIAELVEFIVANSQTLIWVLNTESKDRGKTDYCVRAAIWAVTLARQIGLNKNELLILFTGTLLADIGMCLLPERLVDKRGPFRKKEFLAYKKHIDLGMQLLGGNQSLDDRVVSIVRCHHERHDGLGFPRKLKGEQIPTLARFANLAYCYERFLGSNGGYSTSPASALNKLYKQRMLKFPEQLVVEFIHVMGMYPVGNVVEMDSSELALILAQNPTEKLSPKIALITDVNGNELVKPQVIDLSQQKASGDIRSITGTHSNRSETVDLSAYTFRFSGSKFGLGRFSLRT